MVERYIGREKVHMEVIVINGRAEGGAFFCVENPGLLCPFCTESHGLLSRKMRTLVFNQYHPFL